MNLLKIKFRNPIIIEKSTNAEIEVDTLDLSVSESLSALTKAMGTKLSKVSKSVSNTAVKAADTSPKDIYDKIRSIKLPDFHKLNREERKALKNFLNASN